MQKWRRWLSALVAVALVVGIGYLAFALLFVKFFVNLWWFRSLHYEGYFWLRTLYRYAVFGAVTLVFFLIFFLNFLLASRYLGTKIDPDEKPKRTYQAMLHMFRYGSMKVYTPLSVLLALPVALPLYREWEAFLLYVFGPAAGRVDPVFHKDIGYYLFSFPIYLVIQHRLLIAFSLLFIGLLVLYWLEHRVLTGDSRHLPRGAKVHLSILIFMICSIQIWGYILQRHALLYCTHHEPLFYGPGFEEMWVTLPLIWMTLIFFVATGYSLAHYIHTRRGLKFVIALSLSFIAVTALRYWRAPLLTVEKYIVKPNEIIKERSYIARNIHETLAAYKLQDVDVREYDAERIPWTASAPTVQRSLRNIPVWDRDLLDEVYLQLQGIRPYYDFKSVDVDRYTVGKRYQQVYLGAREMNTAALPPYAQSWINRHLQYTHGKGVVMTPAAMGGDEFMPWFVQDIPPVSKYGITMKQSSIYYGLEPYRYVLAPNDVREFDYPKGEVDIMSDYDGDGGIPISSIFHKLMFSVYFKDKNIFFTTKTNEHSRILIHRNITDRVESLTPYFTLDSDPYIVVTPGGLFWIQDAYTTSQWYPYAEPFDHVHNYVRDSLKIIIDAYNGAVTYYMNDPSDPIVQAYRRMYPGLIRTLDEMPAELRKHLRYPKDIFKAQLMIYGKYHQTDPELYYRQEDIWDFSGFYRGEKRIALNPYYLTLNLIHPDRWEFLLLSPMSPKERDNMRALVVVGCDGNDYGKLVVYSFPKNKQVYGPSQIEALIDQDTTIAQQFTLWNQLGSQVIRGRMIILPLGKVIIYIEPIYLRASGRLNIPELKRLIVSQGDTVVMDRSLDEAFHDLEVNLKTRIERLQNRFPSSSPAPGPKP